MKITAASAVSLAVILFSAGCRSRPVNSNSAPAKAGATAPAPAPHALPDAALAPSPRLIVGRITAVDLGRGFAFVELAAEAPAIALVADSELIARTLDLHETARLRSSRYLRGRTLGTTVVRGRPQIGDEVVWLAP